MAFNIGDSVCLISSDGITEFDNPRNAAIYGTVISEQLEDDMFIVDLDADSIGLLSDDYLFEVASEGIDKPWEVYLHIDEIELAAPRKTKHKKEKVLAQLNEKLDKLEEIIIAHEEIESLQREIVEKKITAFFHSETCMNLPYAYQKISEEILWSILPYLLAWTQMEGKKEWHIKGLEHFFQDMMPQLDGEPIFFEAYGQVLLAYFGFLEKFELEKVPIHARKYISTIKDKIPAIAGDTEKWKLQKKLKVEARKRGMDWMDLPSEVVKQILEEEEQKRTSSQD